MAYPKTQAALAELDTYDYPQDMGFALDHVLCDGSYAGLPCRGSMTDPTPEHCDVCGHPKVHQQDPDVSFDCSEFCLTASDEDKARFKAGLQKGDFAVYPCTECGVAIEDEYGAGCCSRCHPQVRSRERGGLLLEVLQRVTLPAELEARIRAELDS